MFVQFLNLLWGFVDTMVSVSICCVIFSALGRGGGARGGGGVGVGVVCVCGLVSILYLVYL